jgi:CubicO group peptidase (beta-lactamase class C family)
MLERGRPMLGLVIEHVSGVAYEAFVADRLLAPLGLRDTAFYLNAAQEARYAPGHTMPPYEHRFVRAPYQDLKSWNACGMLASTTQDVLALARLQWRLGPLLPEATRNEMHRLHSMDTDVTVWRIGYGLGWRLYRYGTRFSPWGRRGEQVSGFAVLARPRGGRAITNGNRRQASSI